MKIIQTGKLIFAGIFVIVSLPASAADLKYDKVTIETLPANPGKHWIWVNDPNFLAASEGKAWLIDADAGTVLGILQAGYQKYPIQVTRQAASTGATARWMVFFASAAAAPRPAAHRALKCHRLPGSVPATIRRTRRIT